MELIRIDDPDDPRVAPFRDIRERDLVGRQGRFIAEGKVVLATLLGPESRFKAESVLVLENRLAGLADILGKASPDLPVHVASAAVMDRIAGFPIHRGILAVARKGLPVEPRALLSALPARALVAVLVGISNHDNVGAIFRNAAAFGAAAVFLDKTSCDPLYRKAVRVSVGAALKVPFAVFEDVPDFMALLAEGGFDQYALSPRGTLDLREADRGARTALFLGTEGEGLPESVMQRMKTLRIDMVRGFDSLNVAAASAVALHHFFEATLPWQGADVH
jgi:tRNA G18 (ribose-2'-O)-methylase SpoU